MTKRSADKKEKTKKAEGQAVETKTLPEAKETHKALVKPGLNTDLYWYAAIFLAFLFSFYLRAIIPMKSVFIGNEVRFSSESDAWYHMMLAKSTVLNLQRPWFDPMTYFPHGTPIHFGPFNSWGIALISLIAGLGHPSTHTIDTIGAFFPAILGALLVFPVYFIGRELAGKSCGLISALIVAVLPGQVFSRTTLGFVDHHAAEIFLSTLTIAMFMLAMSKSKGLSFKSLTKSLPSVKEPLIFSVLAGVSLGLYLDAWASGFLIEGIILFFVLIQSIVEFLKGRNNEYLSIISGITFFVAALMVLPFVKLYNGFSNYYYSLFHPTILIVGVVAVLLIAFLSNTIRRQKLNKYYFPGAILGLAVLGLLVLSVIVPQFTRTLFAGFSIFQPKTGGAATVAEASSFILEGGQITFDQIQANFPGFLVILSPFFLALLALVLLLVHYARNQKNMYMLLIVWSVVMLLLTLAQNRFAYYYGINVAVLTGFLAIEILNLVGFRDLESRFAQATDLAQFLKSNLPVLATILVIFMVVMPPLTYMSIATADYTSGPTSDWLTSVRWLGNNTPNPGMDIYKIYQRPPGNQQYSYPQTAYGVMSWWDYGHMIETVGQRMPNANPFQQGIGNATAGVPGSSPFFLAENEDAAEKVAAGLDTSRSPYLNIKYVMIDWEMATGKFYAMTAWSGIPITRYYGFFYQQQGDNLVPVMLYRAPFFQTMCTRMFYFDGSETPVTDASAIAYRVAEQQGMRFSVITKSPLISQNYTELENYVNQSNANGESAEIVSKRDPTSLSTSVPLEALKHYRLVHESESTVTYDGQKYVKTFEHVPGAIITGAAPAGTNVSIEVPVMTNRNRAFIYKQSTAPGSNGQFSLTVPYSTEGPRTWNTNFDTAPIGPYQLTVGGTTTEVKVPEETVMSGGIIKV